MDFVYLMLGNVMVMQTAVMERMKLRIFVELGYLIVQKVDARAESVLHTSMGVITYDQKN